MPDAGRRQYATKSIDPKNLPAANGEDTDDASDDDNPKPEGFRFGEANRRLLKDRDFRDKVMPMRTFRRMRPWAGARISKAYINEDDLSRLPRFPSAERAFSPRIGVKAKAPAGNRPNGASRPPVAPNRPVTSSEATGIRRNPRRTARDK